MRGVFFISFSDGLFLVFADCEAACNARPVFSCQVQEEAFPSSRPVCVAIPLHGLIYVPWVGRFHFSGAPARCRGNRDRVRCWERYLIVLSLEMLIFGSLEAPRIAEMLREAHGSSRHSPAALAS